MIGNEAHAQTLASHYAEPCGDWDIWEEWTAPEGWTYLGNGASRMAFLAPDGVVYKMSSDGPVGRQHNQKEASLYASGVAKGTDLVRLAACTLYGDILAMEYVAHTECLVSVIEAVEKFAKALRLQDCAYPGFNFHYNGSMAVITDYSL